MKIHQKCVFNCHTSRLRMLLAACLMFTAVPATAAEKADQPRLYPVRVTSALQKPVDFAYADFNEDGHKDVIYIGGKYGYVKLLSRQAGLWDYGADLGRLEKPRAIVAADFDGDDHMDVAIADSKDNKIVFIPGKGDGRFETPVDIAVGQAPVAIAATDLNADGNVDLVVANKDSQSVSIITGKGDGTFAAPKPYLLGGAPLALSVGDRDNDGQIDIAVGRTARMTWLMGDGSGFIASEETVPTTDSVNTIATADLDGDGNLDVVRPLADGTNKLAIIFNNGDGTYESIEKAVDYEIADLEIADLNGDKKPDIATGVGGDKSGVVVLLNDDSRSFSAPTLEEFSGDSVLALAADDVDGDGLIDLVATASAGTLGILRNAGGGQFESSDSLPAARGSVDVAVADFDGDGMLDYAVSNIISGSVTFAMSSASPSPIDVEGAHTLISSDFNGDGVADLAVAATKEVAVYLGMGNGDFTAKSAHLTISLPRFLEAGDFNGDGVLDLLVANRPPASAVPKVVALIGKNDGTFKSPTNVYEGSDFRGLVAGDWNGDGITDLAIADKGSDTIAIVLGKQGRAASVSVTAPDSVDAHDVNNDGNMDLVVASSSLGEVVIFEGDGTGEFSKGAEIKAGLVYYVSADDVTGDGIVDLLKLGYRSGIGVSVGQGGGNYGEWVAYGAHGASSSFVVRDVNEDGWPDLLAPGHDWLGVILHRNPAPTIAGTQFKAVSGETLKGTFKATDEFDLDSTFSGGGKPAHGTYDIAPDGSFTYTPDKSYSGDDQFKVVADNGHAKRTETVEITVREPADNGGSGDDGSSDDGSSDDGSSDDGSSDDGSSDDGSGNGDSGNDGSSNDGTSPENPFDGGGGGGSLGWLGLAMLLLAPTLRRKYG